MSETLPKLVNNILTDIKNFVGINVEDPHFDDELLMYINSIVSELEIVGTTEKAVVVTKHSEWGDYISDENELVAVKTLVGMKTKLVFDPPGNSFLLESYTKQADKMEWLLATNREGKKHE